MFGLFRTPRSMEDLALFARHVAGAMNTRVPLPDILRAYIAESERGPLTRAVTEIIPRIEAGEALSAAMDAHPRVFPLFLRRLTRLGEQGRSLGGVMGVTANAMEGALKSYEMTRRGAMYPLFVLIILATIVFGIAFFIAPKFVDIFAQLGASPKALMVHPFGIAMSWGNLVAMFAVVVLTPLVFLCCLMLGLQVPGMNAGRFVLQIPMVGPMLRLAESSRFAGLLALLVENRVPMAEALDLLVDASPNGYVQAAMRDFHQRYVSGERLGDLIGSQPLFPAGMAVLVAAAEDQGGLAETLRQLSHFYGDRTSHAATILREIFEPVMLVLTGMLVALALGLIYLPLFKLPRFHQVGLWQT